MEMHLVHKGIALKTDIRTLMAYGEKNKDTIEGLVYLASRTSGMFKLKESMVVVAKDPRFRKKPKKSVKLIVENTVEAKPCDIIRPTMFYTYKGKEYNVAEFAKILDVSGESLKKKTRNLSSATCNGKHVTIVKKAMFQKKVFSYIYNGKELHKKVTLDDIALITKVERHYLGKLIREGNFEKRTGYRIYKKDPTKENK